MTGEPTLATNTVYRGKFSYTVVRVLLPNGKEHEREILVHPGAVVLVPVDANGNVILVRQFRKPAEETLLELPAGGLDPDEDPDQCAVRELAEECGLAADQWRKLGEFYAAPGYSTEILHCYLASGLSQRYEAPDDDENIEVAPTALSDIRRMIANGELRDSKTLAGLALALPHLVSPAH